MVDQIRWFAIKAEVCEPAATSYSFITQKTMYGGKVIAVGDPIFIFASESQGGVGLIARGVVVKAELVPRSNVAGRQTPVVSINVERNASAQRLFGRNQVRGFRGKTSDSPKSELDFKLYRQATNKIVGLTNLTGEFLNSLF